MNIKPLYFAFKSPTLAQSLARANTWLNLFHYLNQAKSNNDLANQEVAMLDAISANRQGYQYRIDWGLNEANEFVPISQEEENPQATTPYFSPPMRHPDSNFDSKKYSQGFSLGLSAFSSEEKAELSSLLDMELYEGLSSEAQSRLNELEAQRVFSTDETQIIQDLEAKKEACKNWVLVPFYKDFWEQMPETFQGTMIRVLGNFDEVLYELY